MRVHDALDCLRRFFMPQAAKMASMARMPWRKEARGAVFDFRFVIVDFEFEIFTKGSFPMARMSKLKLRAIVLAALKAICGKEADRDTLDIGKQPVQIEITARVGNLAHYETFEGQLSVAGDVTKNSSQAAKQEEIVAYLLAKIPADKRAGILERLPKLFAKNGTLPKAKPDLAKEANLLLSRLRLRTSSMSKGAVSFTVGSFSVGE